MMAGAIFTPPDIINGLFELVGAGFTWRNAWQLRIDHEIRGVYWPTSLFFAAWGLWNLVYYPELGQWASFSAGVVLVAGNIAWVTQAMLLRIHAKQTKESRSTGDKGDAA